MKKQQGFTLVELVVAMAVFSFMLALLVTGFMTVMNLRNGSVNTGSLQDNANLLTATLEREIRDSNTAVPVNSAGTPVASSSTLCIDNSTLIKPSGGAPFQIMMYTGALRCVGGTSTQLTTGSIEVFYLNFKNLTASIANRPTIGFTMRVGNITANGNLMTGAGTAIPPGTYGSDTTCKAGPSRRGVCVVGTFEGTGTPRKVE